MKRKNSCPSSEFDHEDTCPSCGSPCNIHKDLDENDECNECRDNKLPRDSIKKVLTEEQKKKRYEYIKKWRERNPEKAKESNAKYQKKWAKNNPDKIKEKARKQYLNRKSKK